MPDTRVKGNGGGAGRGAGTAKGGAGATTGDAAKGKGKGKTRKGKDEHLCKICRDDGTMAATDGVNEDHGAAHCLRNPYKGWICTESYTFGYGPGIGDIYTWPFARYNFWKVNKKREHWEEPQGYEFQKCLKAQRSCGAPRPTPLPSQLLK